MMVDTLTIARELRATDLPTRQAEAIAAAIGRSVTEAGATKADVESTQRGLKADIDLLRQEVKADIDALRREVKAEIDLLRQEFKAEIEKVRSQLILWVVSTQVAVGGLIIAIIKL